MSRRETAILASKGQESPWQNVPDEAGPASMSGLVNDSQTSNAKALRAWLPAARSGSGKALGQLLDACRAYLLLIANRELDPDLRAKGGASDLVQETFLEAQQNFGRFRGESEDELLAWLRSILLANVSNFDRRYRRTAKRDLACELPLDESGRNGTGASRPVEDDAPSPSWQAVRREEFEAVERAIQRLPKDYACVVTLVNREHRSFAEAARLMNRSEDATRRLWSRAIERLAHELDSGHGR